MEDTTTHIAGVVKVRKDLNQEDFARALKQMLNSLSKRMTKRHNDMLEKKK